LRVNPGCYTTELKRIADVISNILDLRQLVVVGQNRRTSATFQFFDPGFNLRHSLVLMQVNIIEGCFV
jgi:hypothetical protein